MVVCGCGFWVCAVGVFWSVLGGGWFSLACVWWVVDVLVCWCVVILGLGLSWVACVGGFKVVCVPYLISGCVCCGLCA